MQITNWRALKIWWSYIWRAIALTIPLSSLFFPIAYFFVPTLTPEDLSRHPEQVPKFFGGLVLIWFIIMGASLFAHIFAIRWMLKTQWSDFKLVAVPLAEESKAPLTSPPPSSNTPSPS